MAISDRTRRKGTAAAQKLLEAGTEIRAYSVGVAGPYPLYTVLGVLGEPALVEGHREITSYGGWRAYVAAELIKS